MTTSATDVRQQPGVVHVINGRLALFVRRDEQEAVWKWVEPILNAWAASPRPPKPYAAGTWGPADLARLAERSLAEVYAAGSSYPGPSAACQSDGIP